MPSFETDGFHDGDPELDLAEQKSWQGYLGSALQMAALLNRRLTEAHQLTLAELQLLRVLSESPSGSAHTTHLVAALPSLLGRPARQLRRLEDRGLIRRVVSRHGHRCALATITDRGRNILEQAMITYLSSVRTHFLSSLTRPQVTAMADICQRISESLTYTK